MISNWKTLTLYSLLSAATVVQPLRADDPDTRDKPLKDLGKQIEKLVTGIGELEKRIGNLEFGVAALKDVGKDLKAVKKSIDRLQTDMALVKEEQKDRKIKIELLEQGISLLQKADKQAPAANPAELAEIRAKLNAIQEAVAKLAPAQKRDSMFPSGPAGNVGRVVLLNNYSREVTFIVNDKTYRVPPRTNMILDSPSGALNYAVFVDPWGLLENRVTTLVSGETFTLTANSK